MCQSPACNILFALLTGVVSGVISSVVVVVLVESVRRPSLVIQDVETVEVSFREAATGASHSKATGYRVQVRNDELAAIWYHWLVRLPAPSCRAQIEFFTAGTRPKQLFTMNGRWAQALEPVPLFGSSQSGGQIVLNDPARQTLDSVIDIPAGESRTLDICVHFEGDAVAFGWNNESYAHGGRHPAYRLEPGNIVARVVLKSQGLTVSRRLYFAVAKPSSSQTSPSLSAPHIGYFKTGSL